MELPDEAIAYDYKNLLAQPPDEWTAAAELRAQHFLSPDVLQELTPRVLQVRSQVAAERELKQIPAKLLPLQPGFINLPQNLLDQHKKLGDTSTLGRILKLGARLREEVDRFVVLGIGGSYMGARALFEAMRSSVHNDLPAKDRTGTPRIYFEGNNLDNDALQDLLDLIQVACVDPDRREGAAGVFRRSVHEGLVRPEHVQARSPRSEHRHRRQADAVGKFVAEQRVLFLRRYGHGCDPRARSEPGNPDGLGPALALPAPGL